MKNPRDLMAAIRLLLRRALAACEGDQPETQPPPIPSTGTTPYSGMQEDLENSPVVEVPEDPADETDEERAARHDFRARDVLRATVDKAVLLADELAIELESPSDTHARFEAMLRALPPDAASELRACRERYGRGSWSP